MYPLSSDRPESLHQFLFGDSHYLQGHLKYINPEALLKKEHMVISTAIDDLFFTKYENKMWKCIKKISIFDQDPSKDND